MKQDGAQKLDDWVRRVGGRRKACGLLGISEPTLSRIMQRTQRPGWDVMLKLRDLSGGRIRATDFEDWKEEFCVLMGRFETGAHVPFGVAVAKRATGKRGMATGNAHTSHELRGDDMYPTDYAALPPLLIAEGRRLPRRLWEPSAGTGALANPLRRRRYAVVASDLRDWGCPDCTPGVDFLGPAADEFYRSTVTARFTARWGIVANPPYHSVEEHIERAVRFAPYAAFFLRFSFFEGGERFRWWNNVGLQRVHLIVDRLPMMHGAHVPAERRTMNGSGLAFAWFIFERDKSPLKRWPVRLISWKESVKRWPKKPGDEPVDPKAQPTLFDGVKR